MWPGDHHLRHSTISPCNPQQQEQEQPNHNNYNNITTTNTRHALLPDVSGADQRLGQQLSPPESLRVVVVETAEGLPCPPDMIVSKPTETKKKRRRKHHHHHHHHHHKKTTNDTTTTATTSIATISSPLAPNTEEVEEGNATTPTCTSDQEVLQQSPIHSTQAVEEEDSHEFLAQFPPTDNEALSLFATTKNKNSNSNTTGGNVEDEESSSTGGFVPFLIRQANETGEKNVLDSDMDRAVPAGHLILLSDNHASHKNRPPSFASTSVTTTSSLVEPVVLSASEHARRRDSIPLAPRRSNSSDLVEREELEEDESSQHRLACEQEEEEQQPQHVLVSSSEISTTSSADMFRSSSDAVQDISPSSSSDPPSPESTNGLSPASSTWQLHNEFSSASSCDRAHSSSDEAPLSDSNSPESIGRNSGSNTTSSATTAAGTSTSVSGGGERPSFSDRSYFSPQNSARSLNGGRPSPGSSTRSLTISGRSPGSSSRSLVYESSPASSARSSVLGQQFLPEDFGEDFSLAYSEEDGTSTVSSAHQGSNRSRSRSRRRSSSPRGVGASVSVAASSHISSSHHSRSSSCRSNRSNVSKSLEDLVVASPSRRQEGVPPVYDGALVALVEAMHGSGSSMDFNASLNSFSTSRSDLSPRKNERFASSSSLSSTKLSSSQGQLHSSSVDNFYISSSSSVSTQSESQVGEDKKKKTKSRDSSSSKQKRRHSVDVKDKKRSTMNRFTDGTQARRHSVGAYPTGSNQVPLSTLVQSHHGSSGSLEVGSSVFSHLNSSSLSMENSKRVIEKLDGIGHSSLSQNLDVPRSSSPIARRKVSVLMVHKQERRNSLPARLDQRVRSTRRRQFLMSKAHKQEQQGQQHQQQQQQEQEEEEITKEERIAISKLAEHYLSLESLEQDLEVPMSPLTPNSPSRRNDRSVSLKPPRPVETVDPRSRTVRTSNRSYDTLPPRSSSSYRIPRSPSPRGTMSSTRPASPVRPSSPWGKAQSYIGRSRGPPSSSSSSSSVSSHHRRWTDDGCSISSGSSHGPGGRRGDSYVPSETLSHSASSLQFSVVSGSSYGPAKRRDSHAQSETLSCSTSTLQVPVHSGRRDRRNSLGSSRSTQYFSASSSTQESTNSTRRTRSVSPSPSSSLFLEAPAAAAAAIIEEISPTMAQEGSVTPKRTTKRTKSSGSGSSLDLSPYPLDIPSTSKSKERSTARKLRRRHRQQLTDTPDEKPSSGIPRCLMESSGPSEDTFTLLKQLEDKDKKSVPSLMPSSSFSSSSNSSLSSTELLHLDPAPSSSRQRRRSRRHHHQHHHPHVQSDDSPQQRTPVPTSVGVGVSPSEVGGGVDGTTAANNSSNDFESPSTIWEKIQAEKIRQGKLRARLYQSGGGTPPTAPMTPPMSSSSHDYTTKIVRATDELAKIPEL